MEIIKKNDAYDARFAESLGGEEYDDLLLAIEYYREFQGEVGLALKTYIEQNCQNKKVIKILEAGPGTGITTLEILKADSRIHIVSVDNELKMLNVVKQKFSRSEKFKDRVDFIHSDILEFLESYPDQSFDAFVSVYTLHNFSSDFRRRVIEAISRKLKSGGVFINGDKYARAEKDHKKDLEGELSSYKKFDVHADKAERSGNMERALHLRKIHKEWIAHMWEDEKNKITVQEQSEMLGRLDFRDVEWMKRYDLVTIVKAIKK